MERRKIIENECDCFYDYHTVDKTKCVEASVCPKISPASFKCQRCLSLHCYNTPSSSSNNNNNNNNVHESLPSTIVDFIHDINPSNVDHKHALLPLRQSVYSCVPCCKKTFLTDIRASYQTLLLYKYDDDSSNNNNSHSTTEYDDIHGEVLGANTAGDIGSYNWRSEPPATSTAPVIITEELVFNTSSWCKDQISPSSVHCLGIASGKLELSNKLLVHLVEDGTDNSHLVELDINCGSVKNILTTSSSSSQLCDFVIKAKHRDTKIVLDLNNDLQVTKGQSLEVIKDHHGFVELTR